MIKPVNITDLDLSRLLSKEDSKWTYMKFGNATMFMAKGVTVAVVSYKNSPPVERNVLLPTEIAKKYCKEGAGGIWVIK